MITIPMTLAQFKAAKDTLSKTEGCTLMQVNNFTGVLKTPQIQTDYSYSAETQIITFSNEHKFGFTRFASDETIKEHLEKIVADLPKPEVEDTTAIDLNKTGLSTNETTVSQHDFSAAAPVASQATEPNPVSPAASSNPMVKPAIKLDLPPLNTDIPATPVAEPVAQESENK